MDTVTCYNLSLIGVIFLFLGNIRENVNLQSFLVEKPVFMPKVAERYGHLLKFKKCRNSKCLDQKYISKLLYYIYYNYYFPTKMQRTIILSISRYNFWHVIL